MFIGISIAIAILLIGLVLYGQAPVLPEGKRFEYIHDGYKALIIVSHEIPASETGFIIGSNEVKGKDLARACAMAMKVTDKAMRQHAWPGRKQNKTALKKTVFHFLPAKAFNKAAAMAYKELKMKSPEHLKAYTFRSGKKWKLLGYGEPVVHIQDKYMHDVATKGKLAVHEMIHVLSVLLWGDIDKDHRLWKDSSLRHDGKTLNRICLDDWRKEAAK